MVGTGGGALGTAVKAVETGAIVAAFVLREAAGVAPTVPHTADLRKAFKADKNSLSSLALSDAISSRYFFDRKSNCHTGNQSWLSSIITFCFLTNQRKVQILD